MTYTMERPVEGRFDDIEERTMATLEDQGSAVLREVDVEATVVEKLGENGPGRFEEIQDVS